MNFSLIIDPSASASKPRKVIVPVAAGLKWGPDVEYIYQEKMDGRFETCQVRGASGHDGALLEGELMASGEFLAFDCLEFLGADVRDLPLLERRNLMQNVLTSGSFAVPANVRGVPESVHGGNMLRAVLARGGEGVVRKRLDAPWGTPMEACKRLETFQCTVTGIGPGQSVQISRILDSPDSNSRLSTSPCGRVALRGGKCDQVRVGSIIKVEGFGLTRDGQIREPRPCKDTPASWMIHF